MSVINVANVCVQRSEDSMLEDLIKVEDRVLGLLQIYPQLRDSDKLLWIAYSVKYGDLRVILGDKYHSFKEWLMDKNTPAIESIRRSRQKIQATYPDLAGDRPSKLAEADRVKNQFILPNLDMEIVKI